MLRTEHPHFVSMLFVALWGFDARCWHEAKAGCFVWLMSFLLIHHGGFLFCPSGRFAVFLVSFVFLPCRTDAGFVCLNSFARG